MRPPAIYNDQRVAEGDSNQAGISSAATDENLQGLSASHDAISPRQTCLGRKKSATNELGPLPHCGISPSKFVSMDSLAPARSALAGLRLWPIPFAAPQSAQVASKRFFAASRLCVKLFAWFAVNLRARPPARTGMGEGRSDFYALDNRWPGFRVVNESSPRRTPRSRLAWMVLKMLVGLTNK